MMVWGRLGYTWGLKCHVFFIVRERECFFFMGDSLVFFTDLFTYLLICLFIYFHLIVVFKISGRVGLRILRFLWMANMSVCFRGDGGEFWNFFLLIALFLLVYSFLSFYCALLMNVRAEMLYTFSLDGNYGWCVFGWWI